MFRTKFGEEIFYTKYSNPAGGCGTWEELCITLVYKVCGPYLPQGDIEYLIKIMQEKKFIPAGRYLYYAGREAKFFNNCFSFIAEDSREGWASLGQQHFMALMVGGGCGTYYGKVRPEGDIIKKTGGLASGPIPLMFSMNEIGRNVMQGGSRRSALYASLPAWHKDADKFLHIKDWTPEQLEAKKKDFNSPAPLDFTNISLQYDSMDLLESDIFKHNVHQAFRTGEPGFQFDFNAVDEVGRNACAEFITDRDSDLCNLGSINLAEIKDIEELQDVVYLASQFLMCGSLVSELPYEKCNVVRNEVRKIGLGLMGVHEWLIRRGTQYGMTDELRDWMEIYQVYSELGANDIADELGIDRPVRYRSIAPAGTISILAGTTSGIEPLFATGIKRRFLQGKEWKYQYVVEPLAKYYIQDLGIRPENIETSKDLALDIERRIRFQADMQDYVDMGISSTLNLPEWGSPANNGLIVNNAIEVIQKYAPRLRGLTFYPDGSRGGQPLNAVPYEEAVLNEGQTFSEDLEFLTTVSCKSGACGG